MYNIISIILILISLAIIIIMVARKFSALTSLNVDTIPSEKGLQFKERVVGTKIRKNITKWMSYLNKIFYNISNKTVQVSKNLYGKMYSVKDDLDQEIKSENETDKEKVDRLSNELTSVDNDSDFDKQEKILISIIGTDSKNIDAFEKLGDLYMSNRKNSDAIEAYSHILKLLDYSDSDRQAKIYFNLSLVCKQDHRYEKSLENIDKAIELSPNNPRYLDTMFDLSIIAKNKTKAKEMYDKLFSVNPENKKLPSMKERLDDI